MMTPICYDFFQPAWFIKKREKKVDTNFSIIVPHEFDNVISVIFFVHLKVALDMFYLSQERGNIMVDAQPSYIPLFGFQYIVIEATNCNFYPAIS